MKSEWKVASGETGWELWVTLKNGNHLLVARLQREGEGWFVHNQILQTKTEVQGTTVVQLKRNARWVITDELDELSEDIDR